MYFLFKYAKASLFRLLMTFGKPYRYNPYLSITEHYASRILLLGACLLFLLAILMLSFATKGIVLLVLVVMIEIVELSLLAGRGFWVYMTYKQAKKDNLPVPADFWKDDVSYSSSWED